MGFEELDIVILTYRAADMAIETARKAQAAAPGAAIYVVDNGSGDGSVERLRAALPGLTVVANADNLGFGGGMNSGIREGKRPFVLVQANDSWPIGDAYGELLRRIQTDARLAAVTPVLLEHDQPVAHFRPEPPAWRIVLSLAPGWWRWQEPRVEKPPEEVDWISSFAATLFRRQALEQAGAFDPGYFLGWEEWDFSRRLRARGWRVAVHPAAQVVHSGASHVPNDAARMRRAAHGRNGLLHHLRKHHGQAWYLAGRAVNTVTAGWLRLTRKGAPPSTAPGRAG